MCKHNQKTLYTTTVRACCKERIHEWVTGAASQQRGGFSVANTEPQRAAPAGAHPTGPGALAAPCTAQPPSLAARGQQAVFLV